MIVLDYLGLLFICYAVYRALKAWADGMERRAYIRDVMTGRSLAPWEEPLPKPNVTGPFYSKDGGRTWTDNSGAVVNRESVRVRRGIYDQDNER